MFYSAMIARLSSVLCRLFVRLLYQRLYDIICSLCQLCFNHLTESSCELNIVTNYNQCVIRDAHQKHLILTSLAQREQMRMNIS